MSTAATVAIGAAAAAHARALAQEEEEMTTYSTQDLAEGWEFKILRSATNAFKQPEQLHKYLEEEARAGWVLVEKFDDGRLRLKRPASARQMDGKLEFDAYRTHVGTSPGALAAMIVVGAIGGSIAILFLIMALVNAFR